MIMISNVYVCTNIDRAESHFKLVIATLRKKCACYLCMKENRWFICRQATQEEGFADEMEWKMPQQYTGYKIMKEYS